MDPAAAKPTQHKNYCTAYMDAVTRAEPAATNLEYYWGQKVSGATEYLSAMYVTSDNTKWNQVVAECAMLKKEVCQKEQLREEIEYMHRNFPSNERSAFRSGMKVSGYLKDMTSDNGATTTGDETVILKTIFWQWRQYQGIRVPQRYVVRQWSNDHW